jgi:hypothetical protein
VTRDVRGKRFSVLVESTRRGCVHCCTVEDVFRLLRHVPPPDHHGVACVILRQPKRKEEVLAPCWGRLAYRVEVGAYEGPAVILEAVELGKPIRWTKSLRPDAAEELARLREDGHLIAATGRAFVTEPTLDAVRATQLYRTLLHEIGHWVHYLQSVERPAAASADYATTRLTLFDRHCARPAAEREAFAHRYADELRAALLARRLLPFERLLDEQELRRDGLCVTDFLL